MKKSDNNIVHIRPVIRLDDEDGDRKINRKWNYKKLIIPIIILWIVLGAVVTVYFQTTTFNNIRVLTNYEEISVVNSGCESFLSGFLKYGKDGVAYINYKGEAIWNQPYQMTNPIVVTTSESAVVADSAGNQVVVVDESGIKGEFETYLPIEKVAVSEQGIVAVLMNDGVSPQVICYDAVGNILVELKSTVTGKGYPTGLDLSSDGEVLLVTYLQVTEDGIASNYVYYSFNNVDQVTEDIVLSGSESGVVAPEAHYFNDDTSVIVSSQSMRIMEGTLEVFVVYEQVFEEEVDCVFYGDDEIGLVLRDVTSDIKELRVYNTNGDVLFSVQINGEYEEIDIVNNQVILYEGENCIIYSLQGVEKFNGKMGTELSGVFPIFGINKYIVIGDEGMQEVRLTR